MHDIGYNRHKAQSDKCAAEAKKRDEEDRVRHPHLYEKKAEKTYLPDNDHYVLHHGKRVRVQ